MFKSFAWVMFEKFGYSIITLLSNIILARLINPMEFGILASVAIITAVANMIIESGLGAAIVQKKNISDNDYNTVFTFNIIISIIVYIIIFISSSHIAEYLNKPILSDLIKFLGISLILNAIILVQRTILIRELLFKTQSIIALTSLVVSVCISLVMAYRGYGVWALATQSVSYSTIYAILIVYKIRYRPLIFFSRDSYKELFKFGGRIFISSMIQTIYSEIVSTIVAKRYNFVTVGYYSQSQKLINFPLNFFIALYDNAAFPILSKAENKLDFAEKNSKINRGIFFVAFISLLIISFNSSTIIEIVLGKNWLSASHILSILSIGIIVQMVNIASFNTLKSSGLSQKYLNIGLFKSCLGLILILFTIKFGFTYLLFSIIFTNLIIGVYLMYTINIHTAYSLKCQLIDILYPLIIAIISHLITFEVTNFFVIQSIVFELVLYFCILSITYFLICYILKVKEIQFLIKKIKK